MKDKAKNGIIVFLISFFLFPVFLLSKTQVFGTSEKILFSLKGKIYYLNDGTLKLPDFSKLKPVGEIFTNSLNITPRSFSEGFPGVTKRFEWFAIDYKGKFYINKTEEINFNLLSDDGSKLIIDGKCIIDNDGVHPPRKVSGKALLKKGFHTIEVQYFQGPRYQVALVLTYMENNRKKVFNIKDFTPLKIKESDCEINLRIGDKILFDFNKYNLKKEARELLDALYLELSSMKFTKIIIEGYTDSIGTEEYNLKLSRKRADAVANYLIKKGIKKEKIKTIGYGESKPLFSNKTEEGRAKNRRVEIKIIKECETGEKVSNNNSLSLLKIGENPLKFKDKIVELSGYAKGWAVNNIPEDIRKLFLKLPFAKNNTGLSRNWGSFTDGTAVILFPISPVSFGKYKIKAKIIITQNNKWYVKVLSMKKIEEDKK